MSNKSRPAVQVLNKNEKQTRGNCLCKGCILWKRHNFIEKKDAALLFGGTKFLHWSATVCKLSFDSLIWNFVLWSCGKTVAEETFFCLTSNANLWMFLRQADLHQKDFSMINVPAWIVRLKLFFYFYIINQAVQTTWVLHFYKISDTIHHGTARELDLADYYWCVIRCVRMA